MAIELGKDSEYKDAMNWEAYAPQGYWPYDAQWNHPNGYAHPYYFNYGYPYPSKRMKKHFDWKGYDLPNMSFYHALNRVPSPVRRKAAQK